jgi:phage terminase large subunit
MKFNLKPTQYDFIGACEQFPAYVAGVGTGKSTSLIAKALFHSQETPNNLGLIVRKNYTDLRDSTIKDYENYTGRKINESNKEDKLPNGSLIMFRHGDELPTLKNINLGFFMMEQAEEFPDDTTWQFLKMRLRRQVKFRTGALIANTNGHNWIYDIWKKNGCPPNHALMEATTIDFQDVLPSDYIDNLQTLPKKLYRRYVLNSWEESEGLVYDEFIESKHVIHPYDIPEGWETGFIIDHGFRNPTAVLWYAVDFDGNLIFFDEHYEKEQPISHHAEKIKERIEHGYTGISDPSMFAKTQQKAGYVCSIADEYAELGITLIPAIRSAEEATIARVNEAFKHDKIKIFRNCVNTIREINNWKWKAVRPGYGGNLPEVPEDKDNHACDCIKYAVASRLLPAKKEEKKANRFTAAWYMEQKETASRRSYSSRGF